LQNFAHSPRGNYAALVIIRRREAGVLLRINSRINDCARNLEARQLLHRRHQRFAIQWREDNSIHLLNNEVLDDLNLALAVGFAFRSVPLNRVSEFFTSFLRACMDGLPKNMRRALWNNRDGMFGG
jgi:hypothetical protein